MVRSASIINFKGGVSKTTLTLHLACYLAKTSRVLVIDVDHQSSLSIVVMGQRLWEKQVEAGMTVNRIFQSFVNRKVSMPGDEIIVKNVFHQRNSSSNLYPSLDFVSAQFELDDTEIDLASTTYGIAALSDWEKRTLIASWLDSINASQKYDYVLFDCPPATKIVSQNALIASDCYIVPVIPDELSSRGVTHFQSLVSKKIDEKLIYLKNVAQVPAGEVPGAYRERTAMAAIVPSLIKTAGNAASGMTNIHTEQLAALRSRWGNSVTQEVGRHYIGVPEAINAGWPVWNFWGGNAKLKVKSMMTSICTELKNRIDSV